MLGELLVRVIGQIGIGSISRSEQYKKVRKPGEAVTEGRSSATTVYEGIETRQIDGETSWVGDQLVADEVGISLSTDNGRTVLTSFLDKRFLIARLLNRVRKIESTVKSEVQVGKGQIRLTAEVENSGLKKVSGNLTIGRGQSARVFGLDTETSSSHTINLE